MEHLHTMTLQDVQERWRKYYQPRNAILVIAGGIDGQTRGLVEKYFGPLRAGEAVPPPHEPGQPRYGTAPTELVNALQPQSPPQACLAFAAPEPRSADYAPFLVLLARLQARAPRLMAGPRGYPVQFSPLDEPTTVYLSIPLGTVNGRLETGQDGLRRLEQHVAAAIEPALEKNEAAALRFRFGSMLGLTDPGPFELANNPYGVAFGLGRRRQLGLDGANLKNRLEAVTDADLRRVARNVFAPERSVGVVMVPRQ